MKKTLSVVLTSAMALSMFSSVAFGKTSADFTDLKDLDAATKAKFDAMISAEIFDGVSDTNFGLKDEMNRAQFAKVAALIMGLNVNKDLKTSSFTDVSVTDAANGYALPYIEALKAANVTDGYAEGMYNPAGKVTKEQLATFLVRVLGKDAEAKTLTGTDATVSGWAQGYAAEALSLKLLANNANGTFGGMVNATRDLLVSGAYEAKQQYVPPVVDKAAVTEVKAVGAKKLAVQLNGTVDTTKITFAVTRDASTASFDASAITWDAKKQTATITLDSALVDATYAVTIGGVTVDDAKKTASVVATKEKLAKIDIVTASETLPLEDGVAIDFKATNQYGETASRNASSFTVSAGGVNANPVTGKQQITLDLKTATKVKGDKIPVTIIDTESGIQANKIYTVGEAAIVSKVEIGDLVNTDDVAIDSIKVDGEARLKVTVYDQYGIAVTDPALLNAAGKGITVVLTDTNLVAAATPFVKDVGNTTELSLSVPSTATAKDVTVTLIANGSGQTATKVVKVAAPKVVASVEFGTFTTTLAKGDTVKYAPIVVKNAAGEVMSPDEIVAAADKFTVYAVGGIVTLANPVIETTGVDRGKVKIASVDNKGNGSIVIQLKDKPAVQSTLAISAADSRYADRVAVSSKAADQLAVFGAGETTSTVKFKTFDQLNGDFKTTATEDTTGDSKVTFKLEKVSGTPGTYPTVTGTGLTTLATGHLTDDLSVSQVFDKGFTWHADANTTTGAYKLTATLYKTVNNALVEVGTAVNQIEVVDGTSSTLAYTVALDKSVEGNKVFTTPKSTITDIKNTDHTSPASLTALVDNYADVAKKVKVTAVDGTKTVAIPASAIKDIYVTNPSVASVAVSTAGDQYIVGNTAGTTAVTVLFTTATGEQTTSMNVTAVETLPATQSIAFTTTSKYVDSTVLNDKIVWNAAIAEGLKVVDQYGSEYVSDSSDLATEFGLVYYISDIKYDSNAGTKDALSIVAATGKITYAANASHVKSFNVNVVSNGKTATINVQTN